MDEPRLMAGKIDPEGKLSLRELHSEVEDREAAWLEAIDSVQSASNATFHYLERSFRIWRSTISSLPLMPGYADPEQHAKVVEVIGATVDWLSTSRMFLDHIETRFKRTTDQTYWDSFRNLCVAEYDTHFHYRFSYRLRSYAQHLHLPVDELAFKHGEWHLFISRDELLANYNGWGALVRKELAMQPKSVHLNPIISSSMESFHRINKGVVELYREPLRAHLEAFQDMADYFRQNDSIPIVVESPDTWPLQKGQSVKFSTVDLELSDTVGRRYTE